MLALAALATRRAARHPSPRYDVNPITWGPNVRNGRYPEPPDDYPEPPDDSGESVHSVLPDEDAL